MRWTIVAVCIVVAIYGGIRIQDDHAWNPFSNEVSQPASTH
jgi:hypothetical protein